MKSNFNFTLNESLARNLVFIDGLTRSGKSVFSSIISSFENMEHIPLPKAPKKCVFRLVPNSSVHVSKHNNSSEIFDLEGAYWEFEIEIANVAEDDALALDAFLTKLRGQVGKFIAQKVLNSK